MPIAQRTVTMTMMKMMKMMMMIHVTQEEEEEQEKDKFVATNFELHWRRRSLSLPSIRTAATRYPPGLPPTQGAGLMVKTYMMFNTWLIHEPINA